MSAFYPNQTLSPGRLVRLLTTSDAPLAPHAALGYVSSEQLRWPMPPTRLSRAAMRRRSPTNQSPVERGLAATLLGGWGLYQVIVGLYFIFIRPSLLPEDLRAAATTLEAIHASAPRLEAWLDWVFAVLGGQMAASGVLLLSAAVAAIRGHRPSKVEMVTFVAAGLLSVALMSGVNFALGSDFRWLLVLPVILWLAAMIVIGRQTFDTPRL